MLEAVNDKSNALVHHLVQIGRDTRHLRHHANLKNRKRKKEEEKCGFKKSLTDNR